MSELMLVGNPIKKGRKKGSASHMAYVRSFKNNSLKSNPVRKRKRKSMQIRYKRNPLPSRAKIMDTIVHGAMGSVGARVSAVASNFLPLPDALKTGPAHNLVKALIGVGLGFVAKRMGVKNGEYIALGAVTVAIDDQAKMMLPSSMVGEFLYEPSMITNDTVGAYDNTMGVYDFA